MARKNITAAGARGRRDGFDGYAPREDGAEYVAGHAAGVEDRRAASGRIQAACARQARTVTGRGEPAFMGRELAAV